MDIDLYIKLIQIINSEFHEHCKLYNLDKNKINLKNKQIRHVYCSNNLFKPEFEKCFYKTYNNTTYLQLNILSKVSNQLGITLNTRKKNENRIIEKIEFYINNKDSGKYPINKVLNDILGFRYIYSKTTTDIEEVHEYINSECKRIKSIKRYLNTGYKGYHVYFYGDNNYIFPIELQFWDEEHEYNNIKLHSCYKQRYISNTIEYKNIK